MTTKNDDTPAVTRDEHPKALKTSESITSPVNKLAVFSLLLVITLACFVGYSIDYYLKDQQADKLKIQTLLNKQVELIKVVDDKLASHSQVMSVQLETRLATQQQTQLAIEQKMAQLSGRRPNDWLLAEANYLVTMAARKLWQERDQRTALALLKTADQRLIEINEQSLIPLRQALQQDIAALSALPQTQSENIALAIDGLITQIDNLKLHTIALPDEVSESTQSQVAVDDSWQANLTQTWYAFVDGFIKIRKREANVQPLMSAKQQWYLEENLKNKLIQAQLAVYRHQQQAFIRSVELSRQWILQFFDRDDSVTRFMLDELARLKQQQIDIKYPARFVSSDLIADELLRRNHSPSGTLEQ